MNNENNIDDLWNQKIINMVSLQDSIITMLSEYYYRTHKNTIELQRKIFPVENGNTCEECGSPKFKIREVLSNYVKIQKNFEFLESKHFLVDIYFKIYSDFR